ncbi:MAG: CaiB/BaiF CoA transferase family protein [Bacillota bacterium]
MIALEGITVLDLTRLLPGPFCTMFLADFGAEVIKVEEPGQGDYGRVSLPLINGIGSRHLLLNRNKKSITLNMKSPQGRQIFLEMAKSADVIVESFRPGVTRRLGIDYDTVKEINPRIIYCAISGYGQDGPYEQVAGHDINYIGIAGLLGNTGERGGPPVIPGVQVADLGGGGMLAALGILMALMARERQGVGQFVDISMLDGSVAWLMDAAARRFAGESLSRGEQRLTGGLACYQVYETRDGKFISVGALEDKFWRNLCTKLGREDLIPLHQGPPEQQQETIGILREIFKTKTRDEWSGELFDADACCAPVLDLEEAFSDPQVLHRGMVLESEHPTVGTIRQMGSPLKLSATPARLTTPAPELGQHTADILHVLGYSTEQIKQLGEEGAI